MQKYCQFIFIVLMLGSFSALAGCSLDSSITEPSEILSSADNTDDPENESFDEWSGTLRVLLIGSFNMEPSTDPITGVRGRGLEAVKAEFERTHPGATVQFIVIPWENYTPKIQSMISSNEADIYQMPGIADFAVQGVLEPLQPYIDRDGFDLDVYIENQINGWVALGPDDDDFEIYGVPLEGDTRYIAFDKKLFDQWGVEYLSEHPTMDEVLEKAQQMTGTNPETGEENYGVWFRGDWSTAFTLINAAEGQNGRWGTGFDWSEVTFEFDSEEMVNGLEWLLELQEYAPSGLVSNQGNEFWLTENNNIGIVLNYGPGDLLNQAQVMGFEDRIGIVNEFIGDEGMGGMFAGSPISIASSSPNKDLAWEFIKFTSSEFFQQYLWEDNSRMPVISSASEWQSFLDSPLAVKTLETMEYSWTPRYPWASSQPRYILQSYIEGALTGNIEPRRALELAQQESEDWLEGR